MIQQRLTAGNTQREHAYMYKIVSLKVNTVRTLLNEMQFNCFGILKLCCKVKNSVSGGEVANWFRVLDLKSGGP